MLGENAHKALGNVTKEKLAPMRKAFYDVCKEEYIPKHKKCNMKITYRIVKLEDDPEDFQFGLFQVYKNVHGTVWKAQEPEMKANCIDEMREELLLMMQAFELPVIE